MKCRIMRHHKGGAMQQKALAIILKRVAYGDADWIVSFLTRDLGRISGLARSARASKRRFGGALEPGSLVEIRYTDRRGSNLVRIDATRELRSRFGIMKSLDRIHGLARSLELANLFLQERQPAPEKFDLLDTWIAQLGEWDPTPVQVLQFEFSWLSHSGYAPQLHCCVSCSRELGEHSRWFFDYEQGGVICGSCAMGGSGRLPLSKRAQKGFEAHARNVFNADVMHASEAEQVLEQYIGHVLGKPLRTTLSYESCF